MRPTLALLLLAACAETTPIPAGDFTLTSFLDEAGEVEATAALSIADDDTVTLTIGDAEPLTFTPTPADDGRACPTQTGGTRVARWSLGDDVQLAGLTIADATLIATCEADRVHLQPDGDASPCGELPCATFDLE